MKILVTGGAGDFHLGWEPRVPLDEGLTRTLADFRRRLGLI